MRTRSNSPAYGIPVPGFSHAVLAPAGRLLFVSGLTARDEAGTIVGEGDPEAQVRQILHQLGVILADAGASLDDVMQCHTYARDIGSWPAVEAGFRDAFGDTWPTSTFVEVSRLYDDRQLVEIDAVAVVPDPAPSAS